MRCFIILILMCVFICPGRSSGQVLSQQLDEPTKLDLARCLVSEADWHYQDYPHIAFILKKRMNNYNRVSKRIDRKLRTYRDQIRTYCAVFDKQGINYYRARTIAIRGSIWDAPLHGTKRQWEAVKSFVVAYSAGEIKDPCSSALHWGSDEDVIDLVPGWRVVDCGETANVYLEKE